MGTYLGRPTEEDGIAVENEAYESIRSGAINVIDTAINYRGMKSEKSIGCALSRLSKEGIISRNQVFMSTKNGYITNDSDYPSVDVLEYIQKLYVSQQIISPRDIGSGYHVMNPNYIARCIDKSLSNKHLQSIDLVYIHNAFESRHQDVSREEIMRMLNQVFEVYEKYRVQNKFRYYVMASWSCFRVLQGRGEYLSLEKLVRAVKSVGGSMHGFRFIWLPYNLAYSEALFLKKTSLLVLKTI